MLHSVGVGLKRVVISKMGVPCWARAYNDRTKRGIPAKKWAPYSGKKAKFLNWQDVEWKLYLLLVDRNCREKQRALKGKANSLNRTVYFI